MHKWWLWIIVVLGISCQQDAGEVQMRDVNNLWAKNQAQEFQLDIKDADVPKNLIFIIRNNQNYPYSNLFLIATLAQNGKPIKTDTLNYRLANPDGSWIGSGFGDTKEGWFLYKEYYQFPKNGIYTLSIKQGMRQDTLRGIEDIGIKIQTLTSK